MDRSKWYEYNLKALLIAILTSVESRPTAGHHFGPPYLTAYQLAIELEKHHPAVAHSLGYPLGGEGVGQRTSLAQYIGRELSRRIHTGEITQIEGALLSDWDLAEVVFKHDGERIKSSLAGYGMDHALFRVVKPHE